MAALCAGARTCNRAQLMDLPLHLLPEAARQRILAHLPAPLPTAAPFGDGAPSPSHAVAPSPLPTPPHLLHQHLQQAGWAVQDAVLTPQEVEVGAHARAAISTSAAAAAAEQLKHIRTRARMRTHACMHTHVAQAARACGEATLAQQEQPRVGMGGGVKPWKDTAVRVWRAAGALLCTPMMLLAPAASSLPCGLPRRRAATRRAGCTRARQAPPWRWCCSAWQPCARAYWRGGGSTHASKAARPQSARPSVRCPDRSCARVPCTACAPARPRHLLPLCCGLLLQGPGGGQGHVPAGVLPGRGCAVCAPRRPLALGAQPEGHRHCLPQPSRLGHAGTDGHATHVHACGCVR